MLPPINSPQTIELLLTVFQPATYVSLALLFGIAAQFKAMKGLDLLEEILASLQSKVNLVFSTVAVASIFSPFILNDVVILVLTPVLARHCVEHPKDTAALIVAEVTFTNIWSTLTPFGNPQNILLWSNSGVSATAFVGGTLPYVLASTLIALAMLYLISRGSSNIESKSTGNGLHAPAVYLVYVAAVVFGLSLVGIKDYVSLAIAFAGGFIVNFRRVRDVAFKVDVKGLAIIYFLIASVSLVALAIKPELARLMAPVSTNTQPLAGSVMLAASNLVSNVPATQLALSSVAITQRLAPMVAVEAGLAGNVTPIGSLANILALLIARQHGLRVRRVILVQLAVGLIAYLPVFIL